MVNAAGGQRPALRMGAFSFRPTLLPTLAALATVLLTLYLGRWQTHRAAEKQALQARYDALEHAAPLPLSGAETDHETLRFHPVTARGRFLAERTVLVDNRMLHGQAGYHVVTPLRLEPSGRAVLVNRGWIARGAHYPDPPAVRTPADLLVVEGIATPPTSRFLELSARTVQGQVWQNLTVDRFRAATGLDVMPIVIQQRNDAGDGLAREWPRPDTGIVTHQGYAFQWFALSAAVVLVWLVVNTRRTPSPRTQPPENS